MTNLVTEISHLRSLATRGDQMADAVIRVFDALRSDGKEVVLVKAATTANRTLSGLTSTNLDGVTPAAGDSVLVKNQTSDLDNGIYVAAAGAWTRLTNYNNENVLAPGQVVLVRSGTTLAGTLWTCTSATTVVGTDSITFSQFATALGAGSVDAANIATNAVTAAKLAAAVQADIFGTPTLAVGSESANHIDVTITLKDVNAATLGAVAKATVWISDTAGAAPSASAPNGGTTVQTGTLLKAHTAGVLFDVVSNASGSIVMRLTDTGTPTFYVNVAVGPVVASSAAVTFA